MDMMSKRPILNCEIHAPGSRVQTLGWGQYGHIVEMC